MSPFRCPPVSGSSLCHFSFPQPDSPGLGSGLGSLTLHAASSASTLSSVLHIQVRFTNINKTKYLGLRLV